MSLFACKTLRALLWGLEVMMDDFSDFRVDAIFLRSCGNGLTVAGEILKLLECVDGVGTTGGVGCDVTVLSSDSKDSGCKFDDG